MRTGKNGVFYTALSCASITQKNGVWEPTVHEIAKFPSTSKLLSIDIYNINR